MEKARKKMVLVAFILLAASAFTIVAAQYGWFTFIYDPMGLDIDDTYMESDLELKYVPLWFSANVSMVGSGYSGQVHIISLSIYHDRPPNGIPWYADGSYSLDLKLEGNIVESIMSGSFTDLATTDPYTTSYLWTPISQPNTYKIALNITDVSWREVPTYTIIANSGTGGTISPSGPVTVLEGGNQTFTSTADDGYLFDSFLIDEEMSFYTLGNYTFTNVTTHHTIKAVFAQTTANFDSANGAFEDNTTVHNDWGAIYANSTYEEALTYAYEPNTQTVNFTYTILRNGTKGTFVLTYRFDIERVNGENRTTVVTSKSKSYDWSANNDMWTLTGNFTAPDAGDWSLIMVAEELQP